MRIRKIGRIAVDLLAGALVLAALASLTGVPARFAKLSREEGATGRGAPILVQQAGSQTTGRACEQPTLIGRVVVGSVAARTFASPRAPVVATFGKTNPQGAAQVFDLLGTTNDSAGNLWFRALLPVRPNGTTGYIRAGSLLVVQTSYRMVVDRHKLRLTVLKGCTQIFKFRIGLGKESTPTPNGKFYVISLLRPPLAGSVYGKYAYGLSAFSNAITDWKGGGVIGIHGTNDPSSIGDRRSHGCIRLHNRDISKLVALLPLGTPVQIK